MIRFQDKMILALFVPSINQKLPCIFDRSICKVQGLFELKTNISTCFETN